MWPKTTEIGGHAVSESPIKGGFNTYQTLLFMVILSVVCALILSVLASALAGPQQMAKELDRSQQMMIAAQVMNHQGYFLLKEKEDPPVRARLDSTALLVADPEAKPATQEQALGVYTKRFIPLLVDAKGNVLTFEKAGIDYKNYLADFRKSGYYKQPLKLVYKILPNNAQDRNPVGWIIPVNGFGLWDAIYGYLALDPNGDTVIGISWYDQKETPGLGANIAEADWQSQFPGKKIFQESSGGKTDFKLAPIGIRVVKGKVAEVLGDSPKAASAVDGMAGATLTGNGVTDAYRDVLGAYRPFFIQLHEGATKDDAKQAS